MMAKARSSPSKKVVEYLKVTERTTDRLAGAKKIPAFKVGGTWRFSRADIDELIRRSSWTLGGPFLALFTQGQLGSGAKAAGNRSSRTC